MSSPPSPSPSDANSNTNTNTNDFDTGGNAVREVFGDSMHSFTEIVNQNLVAARFGIFATVGLLTAYGLAQTPLFFRYRTVSEIPASYFIARRRLYGRIIHVVQENNNNNDLQLYIRHLSPIGQVLPKSWFDALMRWSPVTKATQQRLRASSSTFTNSSSSSSASSSSDHPTDLLRVKIAGIQSPPVSRLSYQPKQFLESLADERALVCCQLLARQVPISRTNNDSDDDDSKRNKRPMSHVLPELKSSQDSENNSDDNNYQGKDKRQLLEQQQMAICRLTYRPTWLQFLATDVAQTLVGAGNANVSSSMFVILDHDNDDNKSQQQQQKAKVVDSSQRIQDLRKDVKYLDGLAQIEFQAAKDSRGMWSVPEVRELKRAVVEEVEFETQANVFQKIWRWIRG